MSKVWFITGASRGLGTEIGRAALEAGDKVVATARRHKTITESLGTSERLLTLSLDVTERAAPEIAVEAALEHFGRIDVMVNCAGYGICGGAHECNEEQLQRQFDTNVMGPLAMIRAVLPTLRAQRSGHIFNLSSATPFRGDPSTSTYAASKLALEGLADLLLPELAPLDIKVTIVEPDLFRTGCLTCSSSSFAPKGIHDYDTAAARVRSLSVAWDGKCPVDARKLAEALVALAHATRVPSSIVPVADAVRWF